MHRTLEITVPPAVTEVLQTELVALDDVIGLTLQRGGSLKPVGDVLTVHVLNRGADEVLRRVRAAVPDKRDLSIVTAEATSFISPADHHHVRADQDEAIWEEMESGLRHQGRVTSNYLLLMALGGVIAAVGLVSEPVPQAVAFVASAIIAPGFDPMTTVALGLVLRRWPLVRRGFGSALAGYAVLVLAAAATMWAMVAAGEANETLLATNKEVKHLADPRLMELAVAGAGALAGVVMLAAFRRSFQAGPLIAMAFIPAAALIGAGPVVGRFDLALEGLERFGADWGFILALGIPFLWLKQRFLHRRAPLV
ncbi:DUF389 domain-containing protein [Hymenobacter jeollabukensis]|uniref:DUF389 domain-containing protein n=1 Tax=Hymenobacter jeollabukensis TaxID=2025313 RepID=A0A5R8WIE9_9BACT|nr:DUF389 domain-containing protein [Hymenobacter jeollabukensis]TLM87884.1 DUF389 domain-containing protein [Hymenobacter jeollabukensis]